MSLDRRRQMIDRDHPVLSIVRHCELVSVNRSGLYHEPAGETALDRIHPVRTAEVCAAAFPLSFRDSASKSSGRLCGSR